jgi:C-terminal processing protease CtpA/Prc
LDLRSNTGGLVQAGVEVASLWMDGEQVVFTVSSYSSLYNTLCVWVGVWGVWRFAANVQ